MIRTQDIEAEFEMQLKRIGDPSIRAKVVETWYKASQGGGWKDIEELRELPFTVITDAKGISLLQHTKAATEGAVALAKIQMEHMPTFPRVDMDTLVAGALLHDVNKILVFKRDGKNAFRKKGGLSGETPSFPGIKIARETGLPDDIVGVIEYECRNAIGIPTNVEAILVYHADMTTYDSMNFLNNSSLAR